MESALNSLWKNTVARMVSALIRGFETSLCGRAARYLNKIYYESATGRLLNRGLVRESRSFGLLRQITGWLEKLITPNSFFKNRLAAAAWHGSLLGLGLAVALAFIFLSWTQALLALGAALAVAAVLYRAEYGLYIAALIMPFVAFKVLFLLSVLTLSSYLLSVLKGTRQRGFYLSPVMVPLLLFFLVMFYGTVTSVWFFPSLSEFLIPVTGLFYLLAAVNTLDTREKLDNFIFFLAVAGMITACYAIYQYYAGVNIIELKKEWVDIESNPDLRNRAYAVFENPNLLAQYLILLGTLSIGAMFGAARRGRQFIYGATAAVAVCCLVLTYSRGGYVAFAAALLVFAVFKNRLLLPVIAVGGLLVYSFLPRAIMSRLSTITSMQDSSSLYRLDTWQSTISLIKSHWETGVGLGRNAFARVYHTYMIKSTVVPHSHNLYLQVISEFGILGLAVFAWLLLALFKLGIKLCRAGKRYIADLNAAVMGAFAGFLVHSIVDYFLWYYKIAIFFWLLVAILLILEKLSTGQTSPERTG